MIDIDQTSTRAISHEQAIRELITRIRQLEAENTRLRNQLNKRTPSAVNPSTMITKINTLTGETER